VRETAIGVHCAENLQPFDGQRESVRGCSALAFCASVFTLATTLHWYRGPLRASSPLSDTLR
jgi:hypothetical protein